MDKLAAFVAHSFNPEDECKVEPILKFLDSLRGVGFVWQTAERAEVESVSKKVRRIIDDCDVFVGNFTARHPSYSIKGGIADAWKVLRGRLAPVIWTAPSWIVQESGYALKGCKDLILFREPEVEVPGLQADLEYIDYRWSDPSVAFRRANEMLIGLIGKRAGVKVETLISVSPAAKDETVGLSTTVTETQEPAPKQTSVGDCYLEMLAALRGKDLAKGAELYERGLVLVQEESPDFDLFWRATYQRERFKAGQADALEELKSLQVANPQSDFITGSVGECLAHFNENEDAANQFKLAASLMTQGERVYYSIRAADCLRKAKKYREAQQILLESFNLAPTDQKTSIRQSLYNVLKDAGSTYEASGIAEFALHENPGQSGLRFDLGLNYHQSGLRELFLHHYKLLSEHDPANGAVSHNLALAYSECGLPILSVSHYKRAFELGYTLAAHNLGFKYLGCGMADEATALLQGALDKEDCVPEVSNCLGAVGERRVEEIKTQNSKLEEARKHREFLIPFGRGYLSVETPPLEGRWKFPFAEMVFKFAPGELKGFGETTTEIQDSLYSALYALGAPKEPSPKRIKIERFQFSGGVVGRTCKFVIEKHTLPPKGPGYPVLGSLLGEVDSPTTEGLIVFAEDGQSAEVVELKEKKPDKYYRISRM